MLKFSKRLIVWTVVFISVSLILLAMTFQSFKNEIQWNETFAYIFILFIVGGFYELGQWLKKQTKIYRLAFGVGFFGLIFLGWVSGAVGIIGSENNSVNLMYWAVPVVMFIGSFISHFKPRGMMRVMFIAACVQFIIPIIALIISPDVSWGNVGVIGVFIVNSIFTVLFVVSALLFQRAGENLNK